MFTMAEQSEDLRFRDSYPSLDNNAWSLTAIAIVVVGLRIWCRCNGTRRLWWDDHILVISLMFIIADAAVLTALLNQNYKPSPSLLDSGPPTILYLGIFHVLSALSQAFSKTSIVLTFFRLISGLLWKISLCVSIFVFDAILLAHTFEAWMRYCDIPDTEPYRLHSKCVPAGVAWFLGCIVPALSFFFDILLTVLPWKIVRKLRMERYEKIGLAFSMSLGLVAGSAAFARLVLWMRLKNQPPERQIRYQLDLVLWNFIEPAISIIAATLPMLRTLVVDLRRWYKGGFVHRLFHSRKRDSSSLPDVVSVEVDPAQCREHPQERRAENV
ncbi:hypothetical protein F4818DRAFT_381302 [Hypoxylon cercidicola]|nr:hypothetical protein F4818DRAFT_381302 [Hypoxylon cercidicola]